MYKLSLKRRGRYKKPYFNIVVLNKNNRIIEKLGGFNPIMLKRTKSIQINIFALYFWLLRGIQCSFFVSKVLKLIFCV